jgi:hypothetical protein
MKASGKGIAIIILFLVVIPLVMDLIVTAFLPADKKQLTMSQVLFTGYFLFLPRYIWYLIISLTILYIIKTSSKTHKSRNKQ